LRWQVLAGGVATVWMAGILLRCVALGRGLLTLAKLRRSLVPIEDERVMQLFGGVLSELGVPAATPLLRSRLAPAPLTCGLFRPIVVLPTGLVDTWNDEQLRLVLAHEAAHIARHDLYAAAIQWLGGTLFWWNPLLHAVNRRIEQLREHICDDYAVLLSGNGRGLAEVLVAVAEWAPSQALRISGATPIVDRAYDDLESRIARLIEDRPISTRLSWPMRVALVLFAGSLVTLSHLTTWSAQPEASPPLDRPTAPPTYSAPVAPPLSIDTEDREPGDVAAEIAKEEAAQRAALEKWLERHPEARATRQDAIDQLRGQRSNVFFQEDRLNVDIGDPAADDATLALLASVGPIHTLTLQPAGYTDAGCEAIARLTDLKALHLQSVTFTSAGFEKLAKLPQLEELVLNGCSMTDEKLNSLQTCRTLQRISVSGADDITPDGYAALASLPALSVLGIYGPMTTDEALQRLAASKSLVLLSLGQPSISDEGLRFIGEMPNLHYLSITVTSITSAGLAHLEPLHLTDLVLRCPGLDDASLAVIGRFSSLHNLQLLSTAASDEGFAPLGRLTHLQRLVLESPTITGAGLAQLGALIELKTLYLHGEKISDAVFPHLHAFENLRDLTLGAGKEVEHPGITDQGLKQIGPLPELREITFTGTGITKQGLESLAEVLPRLKGVIIQDSPSYSDRNSIWRPARPKQSSVERPAAKRSAPVGENNKDVIQQMATVIQASKFLTPARQDILIATVHQVLGAAADVGADRRVHAAEHLREYLPERVSSAQLMTDEQFAIVDDTFRWSLQNYAAIPAITDADRQTAKRAIASLKDGIVRFIEQAYVDTPPNVRQDIAAAVTGKELGAIEKQAGNYFHVELLYPAKKTLTADEVVELLKASPFLQGRATRYAPVAKIEADKSFHPRTRAIQVGFFVDNESFGISSSLKFDAIDKLFGDRALTGYQMPSQKLMADQVRLTKELHEAAVKRQQQAIRDARQVQ
jgi:hypothetical protein